jgi:hypothetical protein
LRPTSLQENQSRPMSPPSPSPALSDPATQPTIPAVVEPLSVLQDVETHVPARPSVPAAISQRLYISHFLSTWNSRSFEFGAVLFLASIFPLTLLPLSIYALVRGASAILFGPIIGRVIDGRNRLRVVRFSIGKLPSPVLDSNLHGT